VEDPSGDGTSDAILEFRKANSKIKLLIMSRRFGQPAATIAGLRYSKGDRVVVIDVDLQDPPEIISQLNNKMNEGYDVVYATRSSREGETRLKTIFSFLGYRVISKLSEVEIPENTGDFRIMSRRVVEELCKLSESHGFLRGLVAYVGYKQTGITYSRDSRYTGQGKYNKYLGSMKIGLNGLIGFSSRPLNLMSIVGAMTALLSFVIGLFYLTQKIIGFDLTPGLSTTVLVVTFFSGVQLLSLGLLGEYVSRIYDEVKNRPMYIIYKTYGLSRDYK
jgi:dolichol-phosphate mannosyltransferase